MWSARTHTSRTHALQVSPPATPPPTNKPTKEDTVETVQNALKSVRGTAHGWIFAFVILILGGLSVAQGCHDTHVVQHRYAKERHKVVLAEQMAREARMEEEASGSIDPDYKYVASRSGSVSIDSDGLHHGGHMRPAPQFAGSESHEEEQQEANASGDGDGAASSEPSPPPPSTPPRKRIRHITRLAVFVDVLVALGCVAGAIKAMDGVGVKEVYKNVHGVLGLLVCLAAVAKVGGAANKFFESCVVCCWCEFCKGFGEGLLGVSVVLECDVPDRFALALDFNTRARALQLFNTWKLWGGGKKWHRRSHGYISVIVWLLGVLLSLQGLYVNENTRSLLFLVVIVLFVTILILVFGCACFYGRAHEEPWTQQHVLADSTLLHEEDTRALSSHDSDVARDSDGFREAKDVNLDDMPSGGARKADENSDFTDEERDVPARGDVAGGKAAAAAKLAQEGEDEEEDFGSSEFTSDSDHHLSEEGGNNTPVARSQRPATAPTATRAADADARANAEYSYSYYEEEAGAVVNDTPVRARAQPQPVRRAPAPVPAARTTPTVHHHAQPTSPPSPGASRL